MDRSRQMPNSNEQQSSSDDLIAELARLMAEEAQGDRPPETPKPETAATPASQPESAETAGGDNVVRIPSARPAETAPAEPQIGSAWGRVSGSPSSANAASTPQSPAAPAQTDSAGPAARAEEQTPDVSEQTDKPADEPVASAAAEVSEPAPARDPIADLIAEQEREEAQKAQFAGMPRHVFPDAKPAERPAAAKTEAPVSAPAQEPAAKAPEPAAKAPEPSAASEDDVLSLLRSMNTTVSPAPAIKPAASSGDAFSSPIFGNQQAKPASGDGADPLEEIENLIGDAVRLSRDDQQAVESRAQPQAEVDDAAYAAEAAIAAAAAASGRAAQHAPPPELRDPLIEEGAAPSSAAPELDRDEVKPAKQQGGRLVIGAAAATILVAVALGLYWMFGGTGGTDGSVPFIASNTGDAKVTVSPNTTGAETSQPAIFNELDGTGDTPPVDEQIVSRDQSAGMAGTDTTATEPVIDLSAPAAAATDMVNDAATGVAGAIDTAANTVASAASDAVDSTIRQVETPEAAEASLANRKVRTVTVRPDGTIVSNEDTLAANEVLPVVRPNVPALPGNTPVNDFEVATAPVDTAPADVATPEAAESVASAPAAADAVDPLANLVSSSVAESDAAAGVDTATADAELVVNAPYPAPAPSGELRIASAAAPPQATATVSTSTSATTNTIDLIAGTANQVASQLPTATTSAPATTTTVTPPPATVATTPAVTAPAAMGPAGPDAPAYVQLSSQRSFEAASNTLASMSNRYSGLFNGAEPFVKQVDLGERGIYFRVLVPANSLADASGVCSSVKSAGGDCFVRNNN